MLIQSMSSHRRMAGHIASLSNPDQRVSQRAETCLIRYYGSRATELLILASHHPNPAVRFRAVWILGKSKDPRAFEAILKLTEDVDPRVRYDAVAALGELGDIRAFKPLKAIAVTSDPEHAVDTAARRSLKQLQEIKYQDNSDKSPSRRQLVSHTK